MSRWSFQKGVSRFWPVLSADYLFPSDHFLVDDPTMPSGKRIAMQASAIPTNHKGELADVFQWREADGFSVVPPIVAWLGEDVAPGQVVNIRGDHSQSVRPENTTVIINTSTGELVPHFVDQDPRATEGRQSLIIRPLAPRTHDTLRGRDARP